MKILFALLIPTFIVSVLAVTYVQTRAARIAGTWAVFRDRKFSDLYWRDLSPLLRVLVWAGLVAFFLILAFAAVASIVR